MKSLYMLPNYVIIIMAVLTYLVIAFQVSNLIMINLRLKDPYRIVRNIIGIFFLLCLIFSVYILKKVSLNISMGIYVDPLPLFTLQGKRGEWVSLWYILLNTLLDALVIRNFLVNWNITAYSITRLSIKEAMDTIPVGNIFCNPEDRIVFINHSMEIIIKELGLNSYGKGKALWQKIKEKSIPEEAYFQKKNEPGSPLESKEVCLIRHPKGTSWEFIRKDIPIRKKLYTHISAIDVTEEDRLNIVLNNQYDELKEMNEEIEKIGKTLEETQKEQTILELKNRIHDIMGQRLSIIHQILEENKYVNLSITEFKNLLTNMLKDLKDKGVEDPAQVFANITNSCNMIRVNLTLEGTFKGSQAQQSIMLKIIREAVTNAIRHGKAKNIQVRIYEAKKHLITEIKNDGIATEKQILEGDGIRGMRRRAGQAGGLIHLSSHPMFTVELILPKE